MSELNPNPAAQNPAPAATPPAATAAPAAAPASAATPPATPVAPAAAPAAPAGNPLATQPAVSIEPAAPSAAVQESPYEPTGNATVDAVVAGLHKAGADVEKVSSALLETGVVDAAAQAALEKAYGKEVAAALKTGVEAHLQAQKASAATATKTVHDFFGGESAWEQAKSWAKDNVSQEVRDMLSVGLNKGGEAMTLALNQLKGLMEQAGQTVTGITLTPGAPASPASQEIKFSEYIKEKQAASRRGDDQAVKILESRARASIDSFAKRGLNWQRS